ncbi:MPPA1 [Auxenochlorella protothecoides x Auxenochlorella symbiontica]
MSLLRGLEQPAKALGRGCFSTSTGLQAAAPALAKTAEKGFLSGLFGGSNRVTTPLTDPLPGVQLPTPAPAPSSRPETHITILSNGVKVASENTPGATATLGIYVESGSVNETPANSGVSHLLEYLAFKSTAHRTHLRLVRDVEALGANVLASASREQMAYTIDLPRTLVPEALEVLADAVLAPRLAPHEVRDAAAKLEADLKGLADNPQLALLEGLHAAAYSGDLGKPLIAAEGAAARLTPADIADFLAENYTAPRIVLSGAGVDHQELAGLAEPLFSAVPGGPPAPSGGSAYTGGEFRRAAPGGLTHAILAFEFAGGWRDVQGSVAATVLQYLLGGGGSFSAGGPGKGMHSRLYRRVLNQHGWVSNCTALSSIYNDTGLVGIFASADADRADHLVRVLADEAAALVSDLKDGEELERAKAAALSSVLMNLESRAVVAEDIGRQVLTYGSRKPAAEFAAAIQALTAKDLKASVKAALAKPPTLATLGDVARVPSLEAVRKHLA